MALVWTPASIEHRNIVKKRRKGIEIKGSEILVWLKVKVFNHIKHNDIKENY